MNACVGGGATLPMGSGIPSLRQKKLLLPEGKKIDVRFECVFDVHRSKGGKRLKVVLLHLWRVNVKTTGGFLSISFGDFHTDKIAP